MSLLFFPSAWNVSISAVDADGDVVDPNNIRAHRWTRADVVISCVYLQKLMIGWSKSPVGLRCELTDSEPDEELVM
jgi:hypothetical protein